MTMLLKIINVLVVLLFVACGYALPQEQYITQPNKKLPVNQNNNIAVKELHSLKTDKKTTTQEIENYSKYAKPIDERKTNLSDFMPITVMVAVLLFIIRELIDKVKRRRQDKNKKKAISYLIGEEIKINYWSLTSLFRAYEQLSQLFEVAPNAIYRVKTTRFNKDIFEYKEEPEDEIWSGHPIPKFINDKYNLLLPSLAELDIELADKLETTYQNIAELEHFRQTLVLFLANEDYEEVFHNMVKHFIQNFIEEKDEYFEKLNKVYVDLVGEDLTKWRLR